MLAMAVLTVWYCARLSLVKEAPICSLAYHIAEERSPDQSSCSPHDESLIPYDALPELRIHRGLQFSRERDANPGNREQRMRHSVRPS